MAKSCDEVDELIIAKGHDELDELVVAKGGDKKVSATIECFCQCCQPFSLTKYFAIFSKDRGNFGFIETVW